jgi:dipeptidyl-peptidase-3
VPVRDGAAIVDVRIEYPDDFAAQMFEYAERYSLLPTWN